MRHQGCVCSKHRVELSVEEQRAAGDSKWTRGAETDVRGGVSAVKWNLKALSLTRMCPKESFRARCKFEAFPETVWSVKLLTVYSMTLQWGTSVVVIVEWYNIIGSESAPNMKAAPFVAARIKSGEHLLVKVTFSTLNSAHSVAGTVCSRARRACTRYSRALNCFYR